MPRPDAPIIASMREMIADPSRGHITVTTDGPFPKVGIRPELLSDNGRARVWSVTRAQSLKVVAAWDAAVRDEESATYAGDAPEAPAS